MLLGTLLRTGEMTILVRWKLALQRYNTKNSKQTILEKEFRNLIPYFHIHVSMRDLHIPTIGLPNLLQENMWSEPIQEIYKSLTDE